MHRNNDPILIYCLCLKKFSFLKKKFKLAKLLVTIIFELIMALLLIWDVIQTGYIQAE